MPKPIDALSAPDIDLDVMERMRRPTTQNSTESYQKTLNWYIGRRPRTAFTSLQVSTAVNISSSASSPLCGVSATQN